MRTPRPLLLSLTAIAALGAVLLVHGINQRAWHAAHPQARAHAEAHDETLSEPRPTALSALQLLHRDPPRGDVSAGQVSLQSMVPTDVSPTAATTPAAGPQVATPQADGLQAASPQAASPQASDAAGTTLPAEVDGKPFEPIGEAAAPAAK